MTKPAYACEMSRKAGLAARIDYLVADALAILDQLSYGLDFVLVDLWTQRYEASNSTELRTSSRQAPRDW